MEFEISLNDIILYGYHGVYPQEKEIGNEFHVSLSVFIPYNEEVQKDSLMHTVSYADLYEIVREEMHKVSDLLENVASRIVFRLKKDFPVIKRGRITITKQHPPIPGMLGSASVTLHF